MKRIAEAEWQGETNPGNYMGPKLTPEGIVIDNSDKTTHTPETEEEKKKRKKEKEDLSTATEDNENPAVFAQEAVEAPSTYMVDLGNEYTARYSKSCAVCPDCITEAPDPAPSADASISLEDLLNDPEFINQLMGELDKYDVTSEVESVVARNLSHLLLEEI